MPRSGLLADIEFEDENPVVETSPQPPAEDGNDENMADMSASPNRPPATPVTSALCQTTTTLQQVGDALNTPMQSLYYPPIAQESPAWTPAQKATHERYAVEACNLVDVPEDQQQMIIEASQLPSHHLMILLLSKFCAVQRDRDNADTKIAEYLKSTNYKQHVKDRLQAMLLSGSVSSYKAGLTQRCVRHIRLNTYIYRIPKNLIDVDMLSTAAFETAISKTITGIRAEIKRKLLIAHKEKKDIYTVVKRISRAAISPSVQMWGRWAWLHLKLIDYCDLVREGEARDDQFWDSIDTYLKERRERLATIVDPAEKVAKGSHIFKEALKLHLVTFPAKTVPKPQAMSKWQQDIVKNLEDMERYTDNQLVGVVRSDVIDGEEDSQEAEDEQEED